MGQSGPVEFEYFHGLTRLRYCELSGISKSTRRSFESFIGGLKLVETLDIHLLVNHPSLPDDIWNVKTLRHVKLWRYTPGPSSSADLRNLQTLTGLIFGSEVPQKIVEMQRFPFYQHLQSLSLRERSSFSNNKLSPEVGMFPIHVVELTLTNLQFRDDLLPVLEKLHYLRMLWLQGERENRKMSCSNGGFKP
ncbi:disease resistance protein RPH8A-like [Carex rostrata]